MTKCWLVAAMALTMMTGVAAAQSSSSSTSTTQSTTAVPAPVTNTTTTSDRQHSVDSRGNVTDSGKVTTDSNTVSPVEDLTTTKRTRIATGCYAALARRRIGGTSKA